MSDPLFIAQTFEKKNTMSEEAALLWFHVRVEQAKKIGATFFRYSWRDDDSGLLLEGWEEQPKDQGEPRWSEK